MLILVYGPGIAIGAGKTTLANTIRYVLENYYGLHTNLVDRDDELNARNDPFLETAKDSSTPEEYEDFCIRSYIAMLTRHLYHEERPGFFIGDWAKRIPKIKESLKQMVDGKYEGQLKSREIKVLFCHCSHEIQYARMKKRNAQRNREYIDDYAKCYRDFIKREREDWKTMSILESCGINCKTVDMDKVFNIVETRVANRIIPILDYENNPQVREFIDPLIADLGIDLSVNKASKFNVNVEEMQTLLLSSEKRHMQTSPRPRSFSESVDGLSQHEKITRSTSADSYLFRKQYDNYLSRAKTNDNLLKSTTIRAAIDNSKMRIKETNDTTSSSTRIKLDESLDPKTPTLTSLFNCRREEIYTDLEATIPVVPTGASPEPRQKIQYNGMTTRSRSRSITS